MTADELYARRLRERYEAPVIDVDPDVLIRRGKARRAGRWGATAAAVAVIGVTAALLLPGRGGAGPADGPPPPEPTDAEASLWLSSERVSPGADLAVAFVGRGEAPLIGGVGASVQRWDGSSWKDYGYAGLCLDSWQCSGSISSEDLGSDDIGIVVPDIGVGASAVMRLSTSGLEPGWYRLSSDLLDESESPAALDQRRHIEAAGQFEVAADAPPPAPLWSLDAPTISVTPALLPTAGGAVRLSPVVPADADGSQSAEDIDAVVAGLSQDARLERWAGDAWVVVADVPLDPGSDGNGWDRTAALGPLEPGAYRLVRTGPAGEQSGNLWVVDQVDATG